MTDKIPSVMPFEVRYAATRLAEMAKPDDEASQLSVLPALDYYPIDRFASRAKDIEIATAGNGRAVYSHDRVRRLFLYASALAAIGPLIMQCIDFEYGRLHPVLVEMHARQAAGYLIYLAANDLGTTQKAAKTRPFCGTTTEKTFGERSPAVSLLVFDETIPIESQMAATTIEIVKNRCSVDYVTFEDGRSVSAMQTVSPFQGMVGVSVGYMLACASRSMPYSRYLRITRETEYFDALSTGSIDNGPSYPPERFIVPPVTFNEIAYNMAASGGLPTAVPELTPSLGARISSIFNTFYYAANNDFE